MVPVHDHKQKTIMDIQQHVPVSGWDFGLDKIVQGWVKTQNWFLGVTTDLARSTRINYL